MFSATGLANVEDLIGVVRKWEKKPGSQNTLVLITLADLELEGDDDPLWDEIGDTLNQIAGRRNGTAYKLPPADAALLVDLNEDTILQVTSDLRMEIIKFLQEDNPEKVGQVDQTKLVRTIDMVHNWKGALRFLDAFDDRAKETGAVKTGSVRPFRPADVEAVRTAIAKMGDQKFAEEFVQGQTAAVMLGAKDPMPLMREFYVRLELIGSDILDGAIVTDRMPLFHLLATTLDQMVLRCYPLLNPARDKCAINLNVETVFSNAFQKFAGGGLTNIAIEFRMENAVRDMAQFRKAQAFIQAKGGTVALDGVTPEILTAMDLASLKVGLVKMHSGANGQSGDFAGINDKIRQAQEAGTLLVLSRVDSKDILDQGKAAGITMFQGFDIEPLML